MTLHRLLPLSAALLLGLAACKQATTPTDATATPAASTAQKAVAVMEAASPLTSPREAVVAAMHNFMDARSYHASMHFDGGARGPMTNEVDFVAPDRFRMEMAGMGTQVVIGDTMYMSMRGHTMQVPMPKGTITQWRDPANFGAAEASLTAEALGSEMLDGIATRKYVTHHQQPKPSDVTIWIGPGDLPVQMQVASAGKTVTTVRYSRINDPTIAIAPPK